MSVFDEYGRIGQERWQGFISEEFLKELQGKKGIKVYKEMSENDAVIGAIIFTIKMLIRQVDWVIKPSGNSQKDKEAADFITECMDDMNGSTWTDTISEILSFLVYGWSAHELVYKRRLGRSKDPKKKSKYNDGLIGWEKIPIRAQETLYQWEYEEHTDNVIGLSQMPPPDYGVITIPKERLLLFRTESRKDNPEGKSILRNCYRSWYYKKRIEEIEGVGIERDLAGLPVMKLPENFDKMILGEKNYNAGIAEAKSIVCNIRRDSQEGIVLPFGWDLQLLSTGGRRNFDTTQIIERYDSRIAMTCLADFILLGHQNVGSFALSSDKTDLFGVALGTYIDIICEEFTNNAIPKLIDLNSPKFDGITDYPCLDHSDIESPDLVTLSTFVKDMAGIGVITPDADLEEYLRDAAHLPEASLKTAKPLQPQQQPEQDPKEKRDEPNTDNQDEQA
ncbi:phage portal protein family protein [Acetobacterium tundrae]|uniref:phage portal protein family protein n=1 Tax=Acetobacterium tundrae TaxID=132932 RepID=UPI00164A6FA7|nr:hypothetical protein [Acetobacterium tundrae]